MSSEISAVLKELRRFIRDSGTAEAAARRLGVVKSTLSKWQGKSRLPWESLRKLAWQGEDEALATAARQALNVLGEPFATFNFAHAAAQMASVGMEPIFLLSTLSDGAAEEELEHAAVADLLSVFANARYYEGLWNAALNGFKHRPEHALGKLGTSDYERDLFPRAENEISARPIKELSKEEFKAVCARLYEPYERRLKAATALIDVALRAPSHRLFDTLIDMTACLMHEADAERPQLNEHERKVVAAYAALDMYRLESTVMEAADTLRRCADTDRTLERSPLYAIACKIYESCHERRDATINTVRYFASELAAFPEVQEKMRGTTEFINAALYSEKGVFLFAPGLASFELNAHGTVMDLERRRKRLRNVIGGQTKKAPRGGVRRA